MSSFHFHLQAWYPITLCSHCKSNSWSVTPTTNSAVITSIHSPFIVRGIESKKATMWLMTWLMFCICVSITTAQAHEPCELEYTCKKDPSCYCEGKNISFFHKWPKKEKIPANVQSLTITGCNKTKLRESKQEFGILKDLIVLNLTDNNIRSFASPGSLHHRDLPSLQELILDKNNLTTFVDSYQVFNGLKELEVLSLRQAFEDSHKIVKNLTKAFSHSSFDSLRELILDNNNFRNIGLDLFRFDGGKRSIVEKISLRNCSLEFIIKNTFEKNLMPELNYLDLSLNQMENVPYTFLQDLDDFGSQLSVNFTDNPFYCDCQLENFRLWLNTTAVNIVDIDSLTCHKADNENITGKAIASLTDSIGCDKHLKPYNVNGQMSLPYTILIVIFGVLGILFIIIMYMRRKEIHTWFFTTGTAIKEVFCSSRAGYSDIGRVQRSEVPSAAPAEV